MKPIALWGKRILVVLILLWGLTALAARLATPLLQHARQPIAEWLGARLGQPVQFQTIQASWWGIGPRLRLGQIRVGQGEHSITLDSLGIDFSHISLLRGAPLDALRLTVEGLDLHLVREPDHRIHIAGLPTRQGRYAGVPLPRHLRLRHTRLVWEDRLAGSAPVTIDPIDLDLVRHGQHLEVRGRMRSPLGRARFTATIDGFLASSQWRGNTYVQAKGLSLARLLAPYLPAAYRLQAGDMDIELWQTWKQARAISARGHLRIRGLDLANHDQPPHHLRLDRLAGHFDFMRQPDRWRLLVSALDTESPISGRNHGAELALARGGLKGPAPYTEIGASGLPVRLLNELALVRPPNRAIGKALLALQPSGRLQRLHLRLGADPGRDWRLDARVEGVSIQRWQSLPGLKDIDLQLAADPARAWIGLDSGHGALDLGQLFRAPIPLKRLHAGLYWTRLKQGWRLDSKTLAFTTPDLRGQARLHLLHRPGQPPVLDLRGEIEDAPVASTGRYLPAHIMSEHLVSWLDRALVKGHLRRADVLVSGPLADFPFDTRRSGVFEVTAEIERADLDYQPGWPALHDLDTRLFFHQNTLDIDVHRAGIYDSRLLDTHLRIARLNPTTPLRAHGVIAGPLSDELRLLQSPALTGRFGHIASALRAEGRARLKLRFQVPLAEGSGPYRLDGRLHFDNDRLRLPDWDLDLRQIQGRLRIGLDTLEAKGIQALAFGHPIQVDVTPGRQGTHLDILAHWPVETLRQRFPDMPWQLASGSSDFRLGLDIPAHVGPEHPARLSLESDLRGMALDLPAPLGKTAAQRRRLRLSMPLQGTQAALHIRYAGNIDARFSRDGKRGELRCDRGPARLPRQPGYRIMLHLPQVQAAAWYRLLTRLGSGQTKTPPWRLELDTDRFLLGDTELPALKLTAKQRAGAIDGRIDSLRLAGDFHYRPGKPARLEARLERLFLFSDTQAGPGPVPDPAAGPDPRGLPALDLQCADLRLNKARLGQLSLTAQPVPLGSQITQLKIDGPSGLLQASGHWLWQQGRAHSDFEGRIELPDLGTLLIELGYPRHVYDAKAETRFQLDWPGHPGQMHRATLHGSARIEVTNGRLSEVDPGVAKVLGLLSLDAIKRRLRLDFGDLFKKGYTFDSIKGTFELGDGQARTRDLVVEGPSGRIEIGGRIGLVAHDFDQVVRVTPDLNATLVIASTIAGGPVAGAAAFLAQRLLSDEVDKINRFDYAVTGSWDKPKLTPLKGGGPISELLNTLRGNSKKKTEAQKKAIDEQKIHPKKGLLERLLGRPGKPIGEPPSDQPAFPGQ